jgi:hypothetical protein
VWLITPFCWKNVSSLTWWQANSGLIKFSNMLTWRCEFTATLCLSPSSKQQGPTIPNNEMAHQNVTFALCCGPAFHGIFEGFHLPNSEILLSDKAQKVKMSLITHQKIVYKIWILIYHVQ